MDDAELQIPELLHSPSVKDMQSFQVALREDDDIPANILKAMPLVAARIMKEGSRREQLHAIKVLIQLRDYKQRRSPKVVQHEHRVTVSPETAAHLAKRRAEVAESIARIGSD